MLLLTLRETYFKQDLHFPKPKTKGRQIRPPPRAAKCPATPLVIVNYEFSQTWTEWIALGAVDGLQTGATTLLHCQLTAASTSAQHSWMDELGPCPVLPKMLAVVRTSYYRIATAIDFVNVFRVVLWIDRQENGIIFFKSVTVRLNSKCAIIMFKNPTALWSCRYTTLWNICVQKITMLKE